MLETDSTVEKTNNKANKKMSGKEGFEQNGKQLVAVATVAGAIGLATFLSRTERAPLAKTPSPLPPTTQSGKLSNAAWRKQTTESIQRSVPFVKIDVTLGPTSPADQGALKEVLANALPLPASQDTGNGTIARSTPNTTPVTTPTPGTDQMPEWFTWARLDNQRAETEIRFDQPGQSATPELPANALGIYATRNDDGLTLCLVNHTSGRIQTSAGFRLKRGVYRIERLRYTRPADPTSDGTAFKQIPSLATTTCSPLISPSCDSTLPPLLVKSERLEGSDLGSTSTVRKMLRLEPGEVCFYRCTDVSRIARGAWYETFNRLREMGRTNPGPMRRLGAILHEAEGDLNSLRGARRGEGISARISDIHHLLLYVAQAHSLHKNYLARHVVDEARGKALMTSFDYLTDTLSETSSVLLGLIPQITVTSNTPAPSSALIKSDPGMGQRNSGKEEKRNVALNHDGYRKIAQDSTERVVTISLSNTGGRSVENVKLGLNLSKLPSEVTCTPADPAYFGTLRPGQTVRATYRLRGNALTEMPNSTLIGDVSYFAGTAPAHLRPRAR